MAIFHRVIDMIECINQSIVMFASLESNGLGVAWHYGNTHKNDLVSKKNRVNKHDNRWIMS